MLLTMRSLAIHLATDNSCFPFRFIYISLSHLSAIIASFNFVMRTPLLWKGAVILSPHALPLLSTRHGSSSVVFRDTEMERGLILTVNTSQKITKWGLLEIHVEWIKYILNVAFCNLRHIIKELCSNWWIQDFSLVGRTNPNGPLVSPEKFWKTSWNHRNFSRWHTLQFDLTKRFWCQPIATWLERNHMVFLFRSGTRNVDQIR